MFPQLNLGFVILPSYSVMVALGFLSLILLIIYISEKKEKKSVAITNRLLLISIAGFAVLVIFAYIMDGIFHSIEKGRLSFGGITWLGGVVWAFPFVLFAINKFVAIEKGESLSYFNIIIPALCFAHGFGRIGCFLGGCCFGKVTNSIFGVRFPEGSLAATFYPAADGGSLPVLPTQLFESIFEFCMGIFFLVFYKKTRNRSLEIYCFAYGVFRFILEFLRGDDRGQTGFFLSPSQFMCFILIAYGVLVILYKKQIIFKNYCPKKTQFKNKLFVKNDNKTRADDIVGAIEGLKKLMDEGLISAEEFEEKKKELLSRL